MYVKPKLERYGSFRDLTAAGLCQGASDGLVVRTRRDNPSCASGSRS